MVLSHSPGTKPLHCAVSSTPWPGCPRIFDTRHHGCLGIRANEALMHHGQAAIAVTRPWPSISLARLSSIVKIPILFQVVGYGWPQHPAEQLENAALGSLITHRPTASLDELQCKLTAVGCPPPKGLVNRSVDIASSEQRQWHHTGKAGSSSAASAEKTS